MKTLLKFAAFAFCTATATLATLVSGVGILAVPMFLCAMYWGVELVSE